MIGSRPSRRRAGAGFHLQALQRRFNRDPLPRQTAAPGSAIYVATAAHVLERAKGDTSLLVLREDKADGSFARHDWKLTIRREGKPLWTKHPQQDVAVLRMTVTPPVPTSALPFSLLAGEVAPKASGVHICSPLFIPTYPQRHEASSAGFPVARQGIFASPPLLPIASHPTFQADFTTFSGDSGGPVFYHRPHGIPAHCRPRSGPDAPR